jgi:hypothetical protein
MPGDLLRAVLALRRAAIPTVGCRTPVSGRLVRLAIDESSEPISATPSGSR